MPGFLTEVLAYKKQLIADQKSQFPINLTAGKKSEPSSFKQALAAPGRKLIAEIKPASPSAGVLKSDLDLEEILPVYQMYARAISVLTDERYFGGSMNLLSRVKAATELPVLCKDFVIDPYQILQAKEAGADAVLLIVRCLNEQLLSELMDCCSSYDLAPVVEVNSEDDLEIALNCKSDIILINNRCLDTFKIDLAVTETLAPQIPDETIVISASGIKTPQDIERLEPLASSFLVGSALMQSENLAAMMSQLSGKTAIKICGITNLDDARVAAAAGAGYLGFIFVPESKRAISPTKAAQISQVLGNAVRKVGVFQNMPLDKVLEIAGLVGLDLIQYHGKETAEQCAATPYQVIKAFELSNDFQPDVLRTYRPYCAHFLFDSSKDPAQKLHVSQLIKVISRLAVQTDLGPYFFAGGLDPQNVAGLSATVKPFAVDVARGVERAAGQKDKSLVDEFCRIVNEQGACS